MSKCISESDPSFDADVVRKIVLSFCVQGCYYTLDVYKRQLYAVHQGKPVLPRNF